MAYLQIVRIVATAELLAATIGISACAKLPEIESQACGNFVVETQSGEDCDGYADEGQICLPPNDKFACRFGCADGYDCPLGYACGAENVCHRGAGTYATWGNAIPIAASRLLLGDFDGDRLDDLVTLSNPNPLWQMLPKILFLDETGSPRDVFDPKMPIGSPTIVRPNSASDQPLQRTKLLFSTEQGIATLSASANGVIAPDPYPFQALRGNASYRVVPIAGIASQALPEGVLVLYGYKATEGLAQGTVLIGASVESGKTVGALPKAVEELVGELHAANVDVRLSSPCAEFIFAYRGGSSAYALDPCNSSGQWNVVADHAPPSDPSKLIVTLPNNQHISGNLLTGYVNGDLFLDLVLGDELGHSYVAFGMGDGQFVADLARPSETLGQALPIEINTADCTDTPPMKGHPLAIGDLNADGIDDWVMPDGILLAKSVTLDATGTSQQLKGCRGNAPFVGQWSIAKIDDFTRDGIPDLVAGAANEPDLDFLIGTRKNRMNRFGITTEGSVSYLMSGDFDGDLTQDLAFSALPEQSAIANPTGNETVYIAFGSMNGVPTSTSSVGTFTNIRQLAAANYVDTDAIAELGVISQQDSYDESAGEQLALFVGNAGRHPIAPLGLSIMEADGPGYSGVPLSVVAGNFAGSNAGAASTVAVGIDGCPNDCALSVEYRLWRGKGTQSGTLERPAVSRSLPEDFVTFSGSQYDMSVHLVAGDTDGSEIDELHVLSATRRDNEIALWPVVADANVFSQDPDLQTALAPLPLGAPVLTTGRLLPNSNPTRLDLDSDGDLDLIFLANYPGAAIAPVNRLQVAWNNNGELVFPDEPIEFDLGGEVPLGLYARTADKVARLLVVTEAHIFEIPLDEKGHRSRAGRALEMGSDAYVPGGKAVALGDLTGDGLLDVVVSRQGSVHIFAEKQYSP